MADPDDPQRPPDGPPWRADQLDWPVTSAVGPGLRGALVGATRVAWHDPATGRAGYREDAAHTLIGTQPFDDVAFRLISGAWPGEDADGWSRFRAAMRTGAAVPGASREVLAALQGRATPLARLRAGLSAACCEDQDTLSVEDAAALLGRCAAISALAVGRSSGSDTTADADADPEATADAGIAAQLAAAVGVPGAAGVLGAALVAVADIADNGLDAGTFAGLVVGSCLGDPHAALLAALAALEGAWPRESVPGATAITPPDARIAPLVAVASAAPVAPGVGHGDGDSPALDAAVAGGRILPVAAAVLARAGVPSADIAPVLAVGRLAGVLARMVELRADVRLFRPFARYVGPAPRPFTPLDERG